MCMSGESADTAIPRVAHFARQRDVDGPISCPRMVSTLPADGDPGLADSPQEATGDILDTTAAGPAVIRGSLLRFGAYAIGMLATVASSAVVIRHLGLIDTGH